MARSFFFLLMILISSGSARAQEAAAEAALPAASVDAAPVAESAPAPAAEVAPAPAAETAPAPTAEVAPAPAPVEVASYREPAESRRSLYVGPVFSIISLPRPLSVGLEAKYLDLLGFSFNYGLLPELKVSSAKLRVDGWDMRLKVYPFKGSFFLGVAYGNQHFGASTTVDITNGPVTVPTTISLTQNNTFIAPHIGWTWGSGFGFFMGLDLGVQLSMSRRTTVSTDQTDPVVVGSSEYLENKQDLEDMADKFGKIPLPMFTLLKFGFFF
jgi:hypothetical protein